MGVASGPRFPGIENGLVFAVDPLNQESWAGPDSNIVNNIPPLSSTISGSIYNDTSGSLGISGSFVFDGVDSYIGGTNTTYLNDVSQMSLSIWFNLDAAAQNKGLIGDFAAISLAATNGHFVLVTKSASGDNYSFRLYLIRSDAVEASINISDRPFTAGQWHNMVMTYNAGTVKFYVDGTLVSSAIYDAANGIPTTLGSTAKPLDIGRYVSLEWDGNIGPVLIYTRALTALEASQNYNQLKPRFT